MPIAMPGSRLRSRSCFYGPDTQDTSLISDVLKQVESIGKGLQICFHLHSTACVVHCEQVHGIDQFTKSSTRLSAEGREVLAEVGSGRP